MQLLPRSMGAVAKGLTSWSPQIFDYDSRIAGRCGWQTNVKLTAWISFTLHCMGLLIAQSGHSSALHQCQPSAVKRTLIGRCEMSASDPKRTLVSGIGPIV